MTLSVNNIFKPATTNKKRQELYRNIGLRRYSEGTKYINYLVKHWLKNPDKEINYKNIYLILKQRAKEKDIDFNKMNKSILNELKHLESRIPSNRRTLRKISIYLIQNYNFIGYKKILTELIRGIIRELSN